MANHPRTLRRQLVPVALVAALALTACPEERPGTTTEIPRQRIPPAMSIEPPAAPRAGLPLLAPERAGLPALQPPDGSASGPEANAVTPTPRRP